MIGAHVAGVPVEETLPAIATWVGAGLVVARSWLAGRVRQRR